MPSPSSDSRRCTRKVPTTGALTPTTSAASSARWNSGTVRLASSPLLRGPLAAGAPGVPRAGSWRAGTRQAPLGRRLGRHDVVEVEVVVLVQVRRRGSRGAGVLGPGDRAVVHDRAGTEHDRAVEQVAE